MIFSEMGVFVMIDLFECCTEIASVGIIVDFTEDTETYIVGSPVRCGICNHRDFQFYSALIKMNTPERLSPAQAFPPCRFWTASTLQNRISSLCMRI